MNDEDTEWFGGRDRDPQNVVCALRRGPEEDYDRAFEGTGFRRGPPTVGFDREAYDPARSSERVAGYLSRG